MESWYVLGAGSIGRLFAQRLQAAGSSVTLLARETPRPAAPPSCLLVATKVPDTLDALAGCLTGDGSGQLVLLLQNGMGTGERVRARWPGVRLWLAVTTAAAWRDAQGTLQVIATGDTEAGRLDEAGDARRDAAVQALADAGLLAVVADIRPALWRKLAVNALINPLTALAGCRNGELPAVPGAAAQLAALAAEVDAVAAAEGVSLDSLALATGVMQRTAGNYSSMNRDLAAGRRTEIEAITGHVVTCAVRHGIPVPHNRRLLQAVRDREAGARHA